jgi:hypothetical protein
MRFNDVGLCMLRAIRKQGHEKSSDGRMVGHIRSELRTSLSGDRQWYDVVCLRRLELRRGLRISCHTRCSKYFSLV